MTRDLFIWSVTALAIGLHAAAVYLSSRFVFTTFRMTETADLPTPPKVRTLISRLGILIGLLVATLLVSGFWAIGSGNPASNVKLGVDLFIMAFSNFMILIVHVALGSPQSKAPKKLQRLRALQIGFLLISALAAVFYIHVLKFLASRI